MINVRLLLVEDDPRIASFVARGLLAEGYSVEMAVDGINGLHLALTQRFDLIILDRMLPGLEGVDVCKRLRAKGCQSLILMLTARAELQDKIDGLKEGADDYLTKPFAFDELLIRIEVLLRRQGKQSNGIVAHTTLEVGPLRLNTATKEVWRDGQRLHLTAKEFALLNYLMANSGTVVSRTKILSHVWGLNFDPGTKVVDVYIRYVRIKIGKLDGGEDIIRTVRGFGYAIGYN